MYRYVLTLPPQITPGSRLTIQCKAGYAFNQYLMPLCVHTNKLVNFS